MEKITLLRAVTEGERLLQRPKPFLYQAVHVFTSAVQLDILIWESMGMDSHLEAASGGHERKCS